MNDIPVNDPYGQSMLDTLNEIEPGIWHNLHKISELPEAKSSKIINYFLELACKAQNMRNITLGREGIWSLPKNWISDRIERIANDSLDLEDEWEYRRLLEVFKELDIDLLNRLIERGLKSDNAEVVEAAEDFSV